MYVSTDPQKYVLRTAGVGRSNLPIVAARRSWFWLLALILSALLLQGPRVTGRSLGPQSELHTQSSGDEPRRSGLWPSGGGSLQHPAATTTSFLSLHRGRIQHRGHLRSHVSAPLRPQVAASKGFNDTGTGDNGGLKVIGPAPTFVPEGGPDKPTIISRTDNAIKLRWGPPEGTAPILYNLLMNRVSVYSGPLTYYEQTGLDADRCYTFQVSAYVDGRWTRFSPALRAASMSNSVDVERVDQQMKSYRKAIKEDATSKITGNPCLLNGLVDASNVGGGPGYVEYLGSTGDFTPAGVEASVLNCQVAKCIPNSGTTMSLVKPLMGHLLVRLDDGSWKLRFLSVVSETNILEYNNPKNAFMKITLSLLGCRANKVSPASQLLIQKTGPAAAKCLELNCTSEWKQYFFCVPPVPGSEAPDEGSLLNINTWMSGINRASFPTHTPKRFELAVKVTNSPYIEDNPIKGLDKTVFAPTGYREPFFLSWLTRLVKIDATPHFPQLLGTFRCNELPTRFSAVPEPSALGGILPPYRTGGAAARNVAQMKIDGDTFNMLWMATLHETFSTDLQTVLDGFKGYALDNEWVRGVAFGLVDAIGVGFHAYGLHHNDLLTMSNIRFKQYPKETEGMRKYWCYEFNSAALSSDGCGGSTEGTAFIEVGTDTELRGGAPDTTVTTSSSAVYECIAGVDNNELPADELPATGCAKLNGETPPAGEGTGKDVEAEAKPSARTSWCVPSDAVDGMQVKLFNFGAASLAKKAVQWWKKGYVFPNTPWYDDMQSVAVILCGYMAPHVANFDARGRDLCKKMREGVYRKNPLLAITHPYFEDYLTKEDLSPDQRNNYVYKPELDCTCKQKQGNKKS